MRALVLGASGGIGQALSARLAADGIQVTGLSRSVFVRQIKLQY